MIEFDSLCTASAHDEGASVEITDPGTGKKTGVMIRVMGVDSKAWRCAQKEQTKKLITEMKGDKLSAESSLLYDLEMITAVTTGWEGITASGKPMKFTKRKARELYEKAPYILDQVNVFIADRRNFTNG